MKTIIRFIILAFVPVLLFACNDNDKLWERIGNIETRLTALEQQCKELNTNITSLQVMMEALQGNDYITGVSVVLEDGVEVGYKITFNTHPAVMIFHGKNNAGLAPVIGVKQADDGYYYWTQKSDNGQTTWILDEHGNKVKVTGSDGQNVLVIPQLKIENGQWMLSVDDGATWENLGSAQGDSFFADITNEEDRLILELQDGTKIELPKKQSFSFVLDKTCISNMFPEVSYEVTYTITSEENQNIHIETIIPNGWNVIVEQTNTQSGKIIITPSSLAMDGKVLVFAVNEKGNVCMQSILLKMNMIINVNAWAQFAYVTIETFSKERNITHFEYKRENTNHWTRIEATINGTDFSAKLTGLRPRTTYVVRPVFGEETGEEVSFTTEAAEQIPYSNFDTWYSSIAAGNEYNTPGVNGEQVWDTGNKGGAGFNQIPTTIETEEVIQGKAARLSSRWAVMKFAAGSLFTGKFVDITGVTNALLDFGIPYTCRPTQLKGYYKYIPGIVNRVGDKYNGKFDFLKGTVDSCHIYIALCDWEERTFHANSTPPGTLVDYSRNNSSVLAYGELKTNRTMSAYEPFTIELEWRNTTQKPNCIVIVATSSKYGDYFTGSTESVLLLDEFELGFD